MSTAVPSVALPWGSNGVTVKHSLLDQQVTLATNGATATNIPFQSLRTVGYLQGLRLWTPLTAMSITLSGGTISLPPGLQVPQLRQIQNFNLIMAGLAPLYQVTGPDLGYLAYCLNGNCRRNPAPGILGLANTSAAAVSTAYPFSFPTTDNTVGGIEKFAPYIDYVSGGPSGNASYVMDIPLTEKLIFPNTPLYQQGNQVILSDAPIEVGLLLMQNNQQNVFPQVSVPPLLGTTYQSPLLIATGSPTDSISNQQWNIDAHFYEVPYAQESQPPPLALSYVVTRQAYDIAVSGQAANYNFKSAGLLLRAIYVAYNDSDGTGSTGTVVDLTQTTTTTIAMTSGATIYKDKEYAPANANRSYTNYGYPPPGILVHDFICEAEGSIEEAVNTVALVNVQTQLAGLASAITRIHVIEERLVPVI